MKSVHRQILFILCVMGLVMNAPARSEMSSNGAPARPTGGPAPSLGLQHSATDAGDWTVAMVGDLMLGSDVHGALPPRHGMDLLANAVPVLRASEVRIGNLEGTLGVGGASAKVGCARCFVFQTPPSYAAPLSDAGFTVVNMANNHAHDFGAAGMARTRSVLDSFGIAHTGAADRPWAVQVVGSRRMCVLGFAPNMGMNDLRNIPGAAALVHRARPTCDLVVVVFHGGAEGLDQTHTPHGVQTYLGENRGDVRAFAHAVVAAGADLVFGSGPHVPRGLELDHGHLIAYSLGNFLTYGGISVAGAAGWAPVLSVRLDSAGLLKAGVVSSFVQTRLGPVMTDPADHAARLMEDRTREDFHGGGLSWSAPGVFAPQLSLRDTAAAVIVPYSVRSTRSALREPSAPGPGG